MRKPARACACSIGFECMRGATQCIEHFWKRLHVRRRVSLYRRTASMECFALSGKRQDAPRNPRFQPPKLKSPFREASVQAEGADRPVRVILANGAGRFRWLPGLRGFDRGAWAGNWKRLRPDLRGCSLKGGLRYSCLASPPRTNATSPSL